MKKFIYLVLSVFVATVLSTSAFAATPDASAKTSPFLFTPTNFKGGIPFVYTLAPGSKMLNSIRVHNFSDAEISVDLKVTLPEKDPMDWFALDTQSVVIPAEAYQDVSFEIDVPATAKIGTTYSAVVSAMMTPDASAQTDEGSGGGGVNVGVSTAYATTFKVNVGTGEPMSIDNTSSQQWSNLWPWIKENINTILLGLILILMAKVAFYRGGKVVKVAKKKK